MTSSAGSGGGVRILAGRYRLDEVIGRGGMSTVYRATDLALDRTVAVKVALDPQAEENPVYVARFKREARAAAALNHPRAVTVYDAGADGATRFIVMEYVPGRSLAEVLREEGPLEPARAASIAEQVADALAAAHAVGIVHRDVKPGNVMVSGEDAVKVLDFGIARWVDSATLTQTAAVLGTAPYMSPEQAMGQPADARSDIYSLGCVLYEMLTGQPPFMADVAAGVLHQHVRVAPQPSSERNPAVPPALDALVMQMLAKSPDDRPQTAAEVRDRLAAIHGQPVAPTAPLAPLAPLPPTAATEPLGATASTVPIARSAPAPALAASTAGAAGNPPPSSPPPHRRGGGILALASVIAVLLAGAAVAFALSRGGSSHSSSTTSHVTSTPPATPTHSATAPASTSTPSSTSSTTTPTTTTTTTTVTSTSTAPPAKSNPKPKPPGPGSGGAPPGQAKKDKAKK